MRVGSARDYVGLLGCLIRCKMEIFMELEQNRFGVGGS